MFVTRHIYILSLLGIILLVMLIPKHRNTFHMNMIQYLIINISFYMWMTLFLEHRPRVY